MYVNYIVHAVSNGEIGVIGPHLMVPFEFVSPANILSFNIPAVETGVPQLICASIFNVPISSRVL